MTADALRHRTATSTDLQRGLCPTTQLIQPADTLPRGLPLTTSSSRLTSNSQDLWIGVSCDLLIAS